MCLIKVAVMYLFSVCLLEFGWLVLFLFFFILIVLKDVLLAPSRAEKETGIESATRRLLGCCEFSLKIKKLIVLMDFDVFLKLGICLMLVSLSLVKKRHIPMCNTAIFLPVHELCCSFLLF